MNNGIHKGQARGAFAGRAEMIEDEAGPDDASYVHERLQQLLVEYCLLPTDEGPCA